MPNARQPHHAVAPTIDHITSDHATAWSSRAGSRAAPRPALKRVMKRPAAAPAPRGASRSTRAAIETAHSGRRAAAQTRARTAPAPSATISPPAFRAPRTCSSVLGNWRLNASRNRPKSRTTATMSSRRSTTMVARAALMLSRSRRASR